jgi:hypothetical protein
MYTRARAAENEKDRRRRSWIEPVVVATGRPVGMAKSNAGYWRRPNALTHGGRSSKRERTMHPPSTTDRRAS